MAEKIRTCNGWLVGNQGRSLTEALAQYPALAGRIFRNLGTIGLHGSEPCALDRLDHYAYLRAARGLLPYRPAIVQSYIIPPVEAEADDEGRAICFDIIMDRDGNYSGSSHVPSCAHVDGCGDSSLWHVNLYTSRLGKYYGRRRSFAIETCEDNRNRIRRIMLLQPTALDRASNLPVIIVTESDTLMVFTRTVDNVFIEINLGHVVVSYRECFNNNVLNIVCDDDVIEEAGPPEYLYLPLSRPNGYVDVFEANGLRLNEMFHQHTNNEEENEG